MSQEELDDDRKQKKARIIKTKLDTLNFRGQTRLECFMRSYFYRSKLKELVSQALLKVGNSKGLSEAEMNRICIIVGSLCKMLVGDIVEKAVDAVNEDYCSSLSIEQLDKLPAVEGEALQPIRERHIREGIRRLQQVNQYPLDTVNSPIPGYENPPESGVITEDGVEVPAHIDDMEEEWLRLMVSAVMEEHVGPEQSSEDTAITEHDLLS